MSDAWQETSLFCQGSVWSIWMTSRSEDHLRVWAGNVEKPWDWEDLSRETPDSVCRPRLPLLEDPQWARVNGWQNLWYNFSLHGASLIAH